MATSMVVMRGGGGCVAAWGPVAVKCVGCGFAPARRVASGMVGGLGGMARSAGCSGVNWAWEGEEGEASV
jgi:hypothetical protein